MVFFFFLNVCNFSRNNAVNGLSWMGGFFFFWCSENMVMHWAMTLVFMWLLKLIFFFFLNVLFQGNPSTHFWIWFKDGILELWFTFEAIGMINIVDVWWSFIVWKCSLNCKEQWSNTFLDYWSGCCFMSFADLFLDWDISTNFEPCCYAYFLLLN